MFINRLLLIFISCTFIGAQSLDGNNAQKIQQLIDSGLLNKETINNQVGKNLDKKQIETKLKGKSSSDIKIDQSIEEKQKNELIDA